MAGLRTAATTILACKFYIEVLFCVRIDFNQDRISAAFVALCPIRTVGYTAIYCRHSYHPLGAILHLHHPAYTWQTPTRLLEKRG